MFGGAPDGFKAARDDPLRPEHGVLDRLLAGWLADEKTDLGPVLEADREAQARFFRAVLERMRPLLRADLLQNVYWPAGAPRRKRAKVRSLALLRHLLERLETRPPGSAARGSLADRFRPQRDWSHGVGAGGDLEQGGAIGAGRDRERELAHRRR